MKKILFFSLLMLASISAFAQKAAEIKFNETTHNFGTFSDKDPVVVCTFVFTNTGNAPLVINQAIASCGCTVPEYTKKPVKPGEKGELKITYNGRGKAPGHFKKTVTVRCNAKTEIVRLYVEGDMESSKK